MNIGVIGSGEMGSLLAAKFIKLGYNVSIANLPGREKDSPAVSNKMI